MCPKTLNLVYLLLVTLVCSAWAANILAIFVTPSYSHQMPLLRLSKALVARGHNLTVLTTNPSEIPVANHTEIDLSFSYELFRNGSLGFMPPKSKITLTEVFRDGIYAMTKMVERQLKSSQMQNFLSWVRDVKFDLVLYENIFMGAYLALAHSLGPPPVIGISTVDGSLCTDIDMGTPSNPAYVPTAGPYSDHMTFIERLYNLYDYLTITYYIRATYKDQDEIVKKIFGEGFPSVYSMEHNKTLLFSSSDGVLPYPKALTPNVVPVGAMHILPPKPLTGDLQKWVDGANDGIIYFSLGSNMLGTALSEEKRNAFLEAFARFPNYRIIWKWEADTYFPGQAENIKFVKWIPQQDLLAHKKVKIFISQCGLQSSQEAVHFGVNLICIPLFGDQELNSKKVVSRNIGIDLHFHYITADNVYEAISEIINNQRYRENVKRLSAISKDRLMTPVEQAVWWVEYVLRHKGAEHLRPATLDLHWTQYLLLDIVAFVTVVIISTLSLTVKLIKTALRIAHKQSSRKEKSH